MCNAWNARLRFSNWASICMWIETSDCFYLMLFCPFLFLLCAISTWDCAFLFSFWPLLTWYPGLIHSRWFVALCKIDICPSSCVKQHVYNNKDSLLKIVSLSCMYMSWWCHWSHTRCSGLFCRCDPRNSASNPLKWYFRSQMPQKTSKYSTQHILFFHYTNPSPRVTATIPFTNTHRLFPVFTSVATFYETKHPNLFIYTFVRQIIF